MSASEFNILFSGDPGHDGQALRKYIDAFAGGFGVPSLDLDCRFIDGFVKQIAKGPPGLASDGNPFKKAAYAALLFAKLVPILEPFPKDKFQEVATYPNEIVAVAFSFDALCGATLNCPQRGRIVLSKPIRISVHYWKDLIFSISKTKSVLHEYRWLSLIYEALAYQSNPRAQYDRLIFGTTD